MSPRYWVRDWTQPQQTVHLCKYLENGFKYHVGPFHILCIKVLATVAAELFLLFLSSPITTNPLCTVNSFSQHGKVPWGRTTTLPGAAHTPTCRHMYTGCHYSASWHTGSYLPCKHQPDLCSALCTLCIRTVFATAAIMSWQEEKGLHVQYVLRALIWVCLQPFLVSIICNKFFILSE